MALQLAEQRNELRNPSQQVAQYLGRTIADVLLPDGTNVNQALAKNGWCWWYQKYAPENVILAELQRRARRSGLGLWADPHPVPPWCYRKKQSRDECEAGTSEY